MGMKAAIEHTNQTFRRCTDETTTATAKSEQVRLTATPQRSDQGGGVDWLIVYLLDRTGQHHLFEYLALYFPDSQPDFRLPLAGIHRFDQHTIRRIMRRFLFALAQTLNMLLITGHQRRE